MHRIPQTPRPHWQNTVEELGFHFHTLDGEPYWDESAAYEFSEYQIDELLQATSDLESLCLRAVQYIIDNYLYHQLQLPDHAIELIERTWQNRHKSLYGRFDLAYDGVNPPKLLEYNADTPTSLLEASVIQWQWLLEMKPKADQFNSIHERLIGAWKQFAINHHPIYFTASKGGEEDIGTLHYLQDTALQAGLPANFIDMEQIGWDGHQFVDEENVPIPMLFKLHPWEWMMKDAFAKHIIESRTQFIEPAWRMLLSNKGILAILWQLFPHHPNLLPAYLTSGHIDGPVVQKPLLSREGANIRLSRDNVVVTTDGPYGEEGYVYQQAVALPCFDGNYPVIGSWIIASQPAGIGIREDVIPITTNASRFVPHYFNA